MYWDAAIITHLLVKKRWKSIEHDKVFGGVTNSWYIFF